MVCTRVPMPGGGFAIVCGPKPRLKRCGCGSGQKAGLLCDWRTGEGQTCDAPICEGCTTSPAPDKDLCPTHAADWRAWLARKAAP